MSDSIISKQKQSITGFKIKNYASKKTKTAQKFIIVLEAELEDIGAGEYDMGDFQKALLIHQDSEVAVSLGLFIK